MVLLAQKAIAEESGGLGATSLGFVVAWHFLLTRCSSSFYSKRNIFIVVVLTVGDVELLMWRRVNVVFAM